jgi:D-glycero-D-manno-heptose 1,7-bisphosphate phosphatase
VSDLRPAVFLDRDGTIIEERGYLDRLDLLELYPFTCDAIRLLNRAGYTAVVVTNQGGIGRGIIDEPFLRLVHATIDARLAAGRARVDGYYFCPHHPNAVTPELRTPCGCRKPGSAMIEQACRELSLDPSRSVMVGDRLLDVLCGQGAGARTVLVRTGHGAHEEAMPRGAARPDAILNNLMEAVGWILRAPSR